MGGWYVLKGGKQLWGAPGDGAWERSFGGILGVPCRAKERGEGREEAIRTGRVPRSARM